MNYIPRELIQIARTREKKTAIYPHRNWRERERAAPPPPLPRSPVSSEETADASFLAADDERGSGGVLEDFPDALFRLGGALEIGDGVDGFGHALALVALQRRLVHLLQFPLRVLVVSKILLVAHEDDRHVRAKVTHFRRPLLRDVLQAVRRVDREAHENHVRVRIRERSKTIVVLLAGGVPQGELNLTAVDFDVGDVVLEDGGDVDLWELVFREDDEEARLSTGSVSHDH